MPDTDPGLTLSHEETVARMKDIRDEVERLAKRDDLDKHDMERWDGLKAEFLEVRAHREALERKADLATIRSAFDGQANPRVRVDEGVRSVQTADNAYDVDPVADYRSAEDLKRRNPWDTASLRTFGRSHEEVGSEFRARAVDAVSKMPGASDAVRQAGTQIVERWDSEDGKLSRLVLSLSDPAYMRSWVKTMSGRAGELTEVETRALNEARSANRAMSLTDTAGGFLVPFQLDPTVILTSDGSYNELRRIARTVVATGDVWNGVSAGAVQWSFDAEAAEVSDDSPTFGQPSITVRTARGFVPISLEASQDAANVTQEVGRLLAQGKDDLEAEKFINGVAASNEPIGLLTALTGVTASTVASTTADTFALADVYKTLAALPARYRARASWLANNGFYELVRQADTSQSAWQDPSGDRPSLLRGKPVYEAEAMDGTVTATEDNLLAVVGDFSNYVIADRIGMTVENIPHLFGANRRPTGQRGWFAYYRVGADSVNDAAFRVLNVT